MRDILFKRISIAWLLLLILVLGAGAIVWKLAVLDGPPRNAVLITLDATSTPGPVASLGATPDPPITPVAATMPGMEPTAASTAAALTVYVSGKVAAPGVYTLPVGSRINDAIVAAGGMTPDANKDAINLAERVSDGEQITVPAAGEAPIPVSGGFQTTPTRAASSTASRAKTPTAQLPPAGKVNINTATAEELDALPGIGPVLAQRIIAYREANGPFKSVADIVNVPGIGSALLAKLKDLITVGP